MLSVICVGEVDVPDVGVVVLVEPDVLLGCTLVRGVNEIATLCPGKSPKSRKRSTLAVTTCTCSNTSGLALSISRMIFDASASRSGVSRITMAFCAFTCCTRRKSSSDRNEVTTSVKSCGVSVFDR